MAQDLPPEALLEPSNQRKNTRFIFDHNFDPRRPLVLLWREGSEIKSAWTGPLAIPVDEAVGQEEDSFLLSRSIVWPTDKFGWPSVFTGFLPNQAYFCRTVAPNPLEVDFANGMRLVGYNIDVDRSSPGDAGDLLRLTLYWQDKLSTEPAYSLPEEEMRQDDFGVAVQLMSDNQIWETQNSPLVSHFIRNREYVGGQVVEDVREFSMPPKTTSGNAYFAVGLYELTPGQPSDASKVIPILAEDVGDAAHDKFVVLPLSVSEPIPYLSILSN